jgi:hypothetical protein
MYVTVYVGRCGHFEMTFLRNIPTELDTASAIGNNGVSFIAFLWAVPSLTARNVCCPYAAARRKVWNYLLQIERDIPNIRILKSIICYIDTNVISI